MLRVVAHIPLGMDPVKSLRKILKSIRAWRFPNDEGSLPFKLLLYNSSSLIFVKSPISDGIDPVIVPSDMLRLSMLVRRPSSVGIKPPYLSRCIHLMAWQFPNSVGIVVLVLVLALAIVPRPVIILSEANSCRFDKRPISLNLSY